MTQTFGELVIGGVLIAPFGAYAAAALLGLILLRPVLVRTDFESLFSSPPVALLAVYVVILTALIVLL